MKEKIKNKAIEIFEDFSWKHPELSFLIIIFVLLGGFFLGSIIFARLVMIPVISDFNNNQILLNERGNFVDLSSIYLYPEDESDIYPSIKDIIGKNKVGLSEDDAMELINDLSDFGYMDFIKIDPQIISYTQNPSLKEYLVIAPEKQIQGPDHKYLTLYNNGIKMNIQNKIKAGGIMHIYELEKFWDSFELKEPETLSDNYVYINIKTQVDEEKLLQIRKSNKDEYTKILKFLAELGIKNPIN